MMSPQLQCCCVTRPSVSCMASVLVQMSDHRIHKAFHLMWIFNLPHLLACQKKTISLRTLLFSCLFCLSGSPFTRCYGSPSHLALTLQLFESVSWRSGLQTFTTHHTDGYTGSYCLSGVSKNGVTLRIRQDECLSSDVQLVTCVFLCPIAALLSF